MEGKGARWMERVKQWCEDGRERCQRLESMSARMGKVGERWRWGGGGCIVGMEAIEVCQPVLLLQMQQSKERELQGHNNFMSRNVTSFRHLIKQHYINENDLNWVINLRDPSPPPSIDLAVPAPPEVYFKPTRSSELKLRNTREVSAASPKPGDYGHLFLKGGTRGHHTESQIEFYGSLRRGKRLDGPGSQSQKQFSSLPFKERKQGSRFIKKDRVKKIKNIREDDFEAGLDGAHRQEQYSQSILRTKNYALLSAFTQVRGRKQVGLPSLAWEVGLRDYR